MGPIKYFLDTIYNRSFPPTNMVLKTKQTTVADKLFRSVQEAMFHQTALMSRDKEQKTMPCIKKEEGRAAVSSLPQEGAQIWLWRQLALIIHKFSFNHSQVHQRKEKKNYKSRKNSSSSLISFFSN